MFKSGSSIRFLGILSLSLMGLSISKVERSAFAQEGESVENFKLLSLDQVRSDLNLDDKAHFDHKTSLSKDGKSLEFKMAVRIPKNCANQLKFSVSEDKDAKRLIVSFFASDSAKSCMKEKCESPNCITKSLSLSSSNPIDKIVVKQPGGMAESALDVNEENTGEEATFADLHTDSPLPFKGKTAIEEEQSLAQQEEEEQKQEEARQEARRNFVDAMEILAGNITSCAGSYEEIGVAEESFQAIAKIVETFDFAKRAYGKDRMKELERDLDNTRLSFIANLLESQPELSELPKIREQIKKLKDKENLATLAGYLMQMARTYLDLARDPSSSDSEANKLLRAANEVYRDAEELLRKGNARDPQVRDLRMVIQFHKRYARRTVEIERELYKISGLSGNGSFESQGDDYDSLFSAGNNNGSYWGGQQNSSQWYRQQAQWNMQQSKRNVVAPKYWRLKNELAMIEQRLNNSMGQSQYSQNPLVATREEVTLTLQSLYNAGLQAGLELPPANGFPQNQNQNGNGLAGNQQNGNFYGYYNPNGNSPSQQNGGYNWQSTYNRNPAQNQNQGFYPANYTPNYNSSPNGNGQGGAFQAPTQSAVYAAPAWQN